LGYPSTDFCKNAEATGDKIAFLITLITIALYFGLNNKTSSKNTLTIPGKSAL